MLSILTKAGLDAMETRKNLLFFGQNTYPRATTVWRKIGMAEDFRDVPDESKRNPVLTRLPNSQMDPEPFATIAELLVFGFPEDL